MHRMLKEAARVDEWFALASLIFPGPGMRSGSSHLFVRAFFEQYMS